MVRQGDLAGPEFEKSQVSVNHMFDVKVVVAALV